jgi:hypothetical protein
MNKPTRHKEQIFPHCEKSERGLIGCALLNASVLGNARFVGAPWFYDLRNAELWTILRDMEKRRLPIDTASLWIELQKKDKGLARKIGLGYIAELPDATPSAENWSYFADVMREKFALRQMLECVHQANTRLAAWEGGVDEFLAGFSADVDTIASIARGKKGDRPALEMRKPSQLADFNPPPEMLLVGDNEIVKGYEGLCLIAGPGSSGKSLASVTLALAGAVGQGLWFGRRIHRQFKTMIIQAENGSVRLKKEFEAIKKNHPDLNLDDHILVSVPPDGGLPFHKADFRAAVREEAARFKPDVIILDTWAQIAADDAAKDVIDKLSEIRSCFAGGDDFPCIVILAHTKKPRADEVRKGRGLINLISGSIALANTARCVYMLLPWSDDPEDQRVYWCCCKLNNGQMYAPTVWERRFGDFFNHDEKTDPRDFGKTEDDEARHAITEEQLTSLFSDKKRAYTSGELVKAICKLADCGQSTAWRAIMKDGYLAPYLKKNPTGNYVLKNANYES